jgi:hypothetical protein
MRTNVSTMAFCMLMTLGAAPALASEPNIRDPGGIIDTECTGVNAWGEADHQITPTHNMGTDGQSGLVVNVPRKEGAYIQFAGTQQNDAGQTIKWFYRVTGKVMDINCRAPIDECPDGPEAEVALRYHQEIMDKAESDQLNTVTPPPPC